MAYSELENSIPETGDSKENNAFAQLFEESIRDISAGQVVTGKVIRVLKDSVFIDLGYKSEARVDRREFNEIQEGDEVQVFIVSLQDELGELQVSKRKAEQIAAHQKVKESLEENTSVFGNIVREVKGGYIVDIQGLQGFLPHSQLDRNIPTEGVLQFKVLQYEPQKSNLVVSHRLFREEDRKKKKQELLSRIKEGDRVKGTVKNVLDYGVFVDIEGSMDAFLHIKDLSWDRIQVCHDLVSNGMEIEACVLKIDLEEERMNIGLKQLKEDPWIQFCQNRTEGETLKGEVQRLMNFGAFVRVEEGVYGLIPMEELSWTRKVRHPKEILSQGDSVEIKILSIDRENHKLSLSLRQVLENPWEGVEEKYPKGKRVDGKIKNITDFGLFIELEDGLVGLLHVRDLDWTRKIEDLKNEKLFEKGKQIESVILQSSEENRSISLGLKQLLKNPWEIFKANHPRDSLIEVSVKSITENSLILSFQDEKKDEKKDENSIEKGEKSIELDQEKLQEELKDSVQGILPKSEIPVSHELSLKDHYKEGQKLLVAIKSIEPEKNRVLVSLKQYEKGLQKKVLKEYTQKDDQEKKGFLGEFLSSSHLTKKEEPKSELEKAEEREENKENIKSDTPTKEDKED